ncbi:MAG: 16S rRNA (cytosine(1402)-N(4))-methyltransferase RsmH [Candidatus Falkowbacteria bacterium]
MAYQHTPVMLKEAIEYLRPQAGQVIVDCTLGGGGYTKEIAKKVGAKGKVIAIDADELAIKNAQKIFKNKNITLVHDNFKHLQNIIQENELEAVDGLVADLGLSSAQLQDRNRGFSFGLDAPLNMAFNNKDESEKTLEIINKYSKEKLVEIIKNFGEERYADRIAGAIVQTRRSPETMHSGRRSAPVIRTAKQLADIIIQAVPAFVPSDSGLRRGNPESYRGNPKNYRKVRIHPATRTFQALRIATNNELENLKALLEQSVLALNQGGRVVIISYHSLEDRIVKQFFKQESKDCICPPAMPICQCQHQAQLKIITKKVVIPSIEEIKQNPRARSAKMRIAEKM